MIQRITHKGVADARFSVDYVGVAKEERKTIQISGDAHKLLEAVCNRNRLDRSMFTVASRLIEWFADQPENVQTAILANVDRGMELEYAQALEQLMIGLRARAAGATIVTRELVRSLPRPPRPDEKPVHRR